MKAIIDTNKTKSNVKNYQGEKELIQALTVVSFDKPSGEFREVVEARLWMGRSASSSVVYATVWIRDYTHNIFVSGTGKAGGGGYHKSSAALAEALTACGVELDDDISGRGGDAMRDALKAVAEALGYTCTHIINIG